jgi:hypothetical protein
MNKVASTGRLQELSSSKSDKHYHHTYHPGDDTEKLRNINDRFGGSDEEFDSVEERVTAPPAVVAAASRFWVTKSSLGGGSFCLFNSGSAGACPVKTKNSYGVLNSSLHDDPTPIKERSLNYHWHKQMDHKANEIGPPLSHLFNGHAIPESDGESSSRSALSEVVRRGGGGGGGGGGGRVSSASARRRIKFKRSQSSSPKRIGEAERQKEAMKKFNPENADWIKKK